MTFPFRTKLADSSLSPKNAAGHCGKHQLHEYIYTRVSSKALRSIIPWGTVDLLLTSQWSYYLPGILAGFSVLAEEKHRRTELAMYVFPKALESAWLMVGMGGQVPYGDVLLAGVGMAMVMVSFFSYFGAWKCD